MTLKVYQLSEEAKRLLRTGSSSITKTDKKTAKRQPAGFFVREAHVNLVKDSLPNQAVSSQEQFLDNFLTNCFIEWSQWVAQAERRSAQIRHTLIRDKNSYHSSAPIPPNGMGSHN